MLTGRLPSGDVAPLAPGIARIVRRALAADPAERYGSAADMDRDLAALLLAAGARQGAEQRQEDRPWIYAVALLLTVATATALWAFLVSVTPRILNADEVMPLVMVPPEKLGDGRMLSRARFETWPTLAALAAFAAALGGVGLLRFYWARSDLMGRRPHQPVQEARWVLLAGIVACTVFAVGRPLPQRGPVLYLPIIGGVIEVVALFLLWAGVLQAWRNGRPLRSEPGLWVGFALALFPPVTEFFHTLARWQP
jgi:serine/threonine-protein kinase